MLTHIVLFKLKDRSPESIEDARRLVRGLEGKVPALRRIRAGADIVRSERSYDLALVAEFDDRSGLEAYRRHPAHVPVAAELKSRSEAVAVVDFEE